jgi:hypothetical protein
MTHVFCEVCAKDAKIADIAASDNIAEDFVNITEEDHDLKCECCIQYKIELIKVTSELKSAMKILEILKEEQEIDDSSMDKAVTNISNQKEGIYSLSRNENWTQATAHSHKRDPSNPTKSPATVIRTTNRFEILHNLNKELTKQTNTTKKKFTNLTQRHRNKG